MNALFRLFRPSPSSAASALAKHGSAQRRLSQREKLIETTRALCEGMGKPVPEVFR